MKLKTPEFPRPADAQHRLNVEPVICYPVDTLPPAPLPLYRAAREGMAKVTRRWRRPAMR